MFCPEGYITLDETFHSIAFSVDETFFSPSPEIKISIANDDGFEYPPDKEGAIYGIAKKGFELGSLLNWMTTGLLDCFSREFRATTHAGIPIKVSASFLGWHDDGDTDGLADFYQRNGLDNAAQYDFLYRFPDRLIEREFLSRRKFPHIDILGGWYLKHSPYRGVPTALDGCPLCIAENVLPCPPERLAAWLVTEMAKKENGDSTPFDRKLPEKIVEAFQTGRISKKVDARALFGRGLKTSAWHATWKEAVKIEPKLSLPGPKS